MPKKKKTAGRHSFNAREEKIKEHKGLLGVKLAEAIAKKEMEASLNREDPRNPVTPAENPKLSKHRTTLSPSAKDREADLVGAEGAGLLPIPEKKPKHRVYVPEKKAASSEPRFQPSVDASKRMIEGRKPILPEVKAHSERRQKKPTESWKPVEEGGKIEIKTSRPSKGEIAPKEKPVSNKPFSWQIQAGRYSDERDIVIGFDLGTACSKVVLQDKQLKKAFSVPFDGLSYKANRYLLPTKVFVDADGKVGFSPRGTEIADLKVRFVDDPEKTMFEEKTRGGKASAFDLVSAYIGLSLKEVRRWFREKKALDYARSIISWELNLGIPARDYENDKLVRTMRTAALTGWNLTLPPFDEIYLRDITKARETAEEQIAGSGVRQDTEQIHPDNVSVIPEIIAEVVGYSRSPMRQNGMYLLVDVGASTLDVSTFILTEEDDEDSYPILFADVRRLGGYELHRNRISRMVQIIEEKLCSLSDSCNGISPLPDKNQYFPELTDEDRRTFSDSDWSFCRECSLLLRRVVGLTKKRRNPLSDEWRNGLPVFLCGGGSQIPLYRDAIKDAFNALQPLGVQGFSFVPLPKPENLETDDIPPADYHRVSVSYGLSFSELDIGKIIPQKELDDIEELRPILELEDLFIDKDKV